jgi:hypothetical protein
MVGDSKAFLDEELVNNAAQAVLHYFKNEVGQTVVTLSEFSHALEKVLRGFGLDVTTEDCAAPPRRVAEADLQTLAGRADLGGELLFFEQLRRELRRQLSQTPRLFRFTGLRGCVKQITGAKRWTGRCQALSDQIVEFLRGYVRNETKGRPCTLLVV